MPPQEPFESDSISTSAGDLIIRFLGHGSVRFTFGGKEFYIDPFSEVADFSGLPKADVH
jgi:L-ascorbate metabolism protein UlaG (beta-lactamase superfamily)